MFFLSDFLALDWTSDVVAFDVGSEDAEDARTDDLGFDEEAAEEVGRVDLATIVTVARDKVIVRLGG